MGIYSMSGQVVILKLLMIKRESWVLEQCVSSGRGRSPKIALLTYHLHDLQDSEPLTQ